MTGKGLAAAAAFCVLAAPGAFAQSSGPTKAGASTVVPSTSAWAIETKNAVGPQFQPEKTPSESLTASPTTWSPQDLELAQARCNVLLKGLDVVVAAEPPMREGAECGTPAPVKLIRLGKVAMSPPPTVTCDMVAALARWVDREVQPLARKHLGAPIVRIDAMSSYSCRNAYGKVHGRLSQHGKANAVDISSFIAANSQTATVVAEWGPTARQIAAQVAADQAAVSKMPPQPKQAQPNVVPLQGGMTQPGKIVSAPRPAAAASMLPLDLRPGMAIGIPGITLDASGQSGNSLSSFGLMQPNRLGGPKPPAATVEAFAAPSDKTEFLRAAHRSACKVFNTVLGPEANNAHLNHFHLDMAERVQHMRICE